MCTASIVYVQVPMLPKDAAVEVELSALKKAVLRHLASTTASAVATRRAVVVSSSDSSNSSSDSSSNSRTATTATTATAAPLLSARTEITHVDGVACAAVCTVVRDKDSDSDGDSDRNSIESREQLEGTHYTLTTLAKGTTQR